MIHRISQACLGLTLVLVACAPADPTPEAAAPLPSWTFTPDMIFPTDGSLLKAEDGVVLPDGRVVVTDQAFGLRAVSPDGTSKPFGRFAEVGYQHLPPEQAGGANGVALEPGGTHILVADVFKGAIYRVEIATEATTLVYQHAFGVNTAVSDRNGGIWFTQSTRNTSEAELWASVATATPDGAVYFVAAGGSAGSAVRLVDSLEFANGLVLDEAAGLLYVAETMGNRVLRFKIDPAGGVSERTVALELDGPDNLERDGQGRLWVAPAAPDRSGGLRSGRRHHSVGLPDHDSGERGGGGGDYPAAGSGGAVARTDGAAALEPGARGDHRNDLLTRQWAGVSDRAWQRLDHPQGARLLLGAGEQDEQPAVAGDVVVPGEGGEEWTFRQQPRPARAESPRRGDRGPVVARPVPKDQSVAAGVHSGISPRSATR